MVASFIDNNDILTKGTNTKKVSIIRKIKSPY